MKRLLFLGVILVLAASLRLYDLSILPNGLHWDEQDTGFQALSVLTTGRDYFGNPLPLFFHSLADFRTPVFIYSAVPSVAFFGLTAFAVRLPSVIFGLISVLLIYYLANLLFNYAGFYIGKLRLNIGHLAALSLAVSPWHVQYGRQSVECNAMLAFILLGLVSFYKSLKQPSWLWVSGLAFGLAVASYSPAKFFIPILGLFLIWIYRKEVFSLPKKTLLIGLLAFSILAIPIEYDGFFGQSGTRFHDLSLFTDPTLSTGVDYQRQYSSAASGRPVTIGQSPRIVDRLVYNKIQSVFSEFAVNYLDVYSTGYLFTRGDQELRHSPDKSAIGQFQMVDVIPFVLGIFCLGAGIYTRRQVALVLGIWFLVGPIPSALTREGGAHAARTFLMLPAFILSISLGVYYLWRKSRFLFLIYVLALFVSSLNIYTYFFGIYRFESARPFQWGFDQAIRIAQTRALDYPLVIVDLKNDSPLMAYMFNSGITPAQFQAMQPLRVVALPGISGNQFGNILLLSPGVRTWTDIIQDKTFPRDTLIISDATQPLLDTQIHPLQTLANPDGTPFLYTFLVK